MTRPRNRLPMRSGTNLDWTRVQDVYTVWESLGDTDRPRTPVEVEVLYKHLDPYEWWQKILNSTNTSNLVRRVKRWIDHPREYYPFEDVIVVQRIKDFHFDSWKTATRREYFVGMKTLAHMYDPLEQQDAGGGFTGKWEELILPNLSERMRRWYTDFNSTERNAIMSTMGRVRKDDCVRGYRLKKR